MMKPSATATLLHDFRYDFLNKVNIHVFCHAKKCVLLLQEFEDISFCDFQRDNTDTYFVTYVLLIIRILNKELKE